MMHLLLLLLKPVLFLFAKRIFKRQMKQFAVEMMEQYAKSTDNDIDDAIVLKIKKAMNLNPA